MNKYIEKYLRNRRIKKIESQLVDAVNMLENGLKSGLSLQQTLEIASQDLADPIRGEFLFITNQIKIGNDVEGSLIKWRDSLPLPDVNILVEAVLVLRKTGGNLIETFSSIARTISERQKVVGRIKVLTTQGISQAIIIILLPFALGLGLYLVAPWYITPLFFEPVGWLLIIVALAMQLLGGLWMRKIAKIRV